MSYPGQGHADTGTLLVDRQPSFLKRTALGQVKCNLVPQCNLVACSRVLHGCCRRGCRSTVCRGRLVPQSSDRRWWCYRLWLPFHPVWFPNATTVFLQVRIILHEQKWNTSYVQAQRDKCRVTNGNCKFIKEQDCIQSM